MREPKQIVCRYVQDSNASEVKRDPKGEIAVPEEGTIIVHSGQWWRVVRVDREIQGHLPAYRVLLGRSVGQRRGHSDAKVPDQCRRRGRATKAFSGASADNV
jgi:hypothetical protein